MQIQFTDTFFENTNLLILPFFESKETITWQNLSVDKDLFSGKKDSLYITKNNQQTIAWIGLGTFTGYKSMALIFRRFVAKNESLFSENAWLQIPKSCTNLQIRAIFNGLQLGIYKLNHFKKERKIHPLENDNFVVYTQNDKHIQAEASLGIKLGKAQIETFNLVDLPSNVMTPLYLANKAQEIASKYENIKVTVLDKKASEEAGLHAFLAVGKASRNEPQFIVFEYEPVKFSQHVGLV